MKASIIIPSYNSKERLYYNLLSLNNQDCDFEIFEVIVVDNGSNDDTLQMLKKFNSKYKLKFKRIEKNRGIAHGRNEAIKMAEGDILIFHDSDMIAPKDFVTKHLNDHKDQNVVVCGISWKRIITFYYEELEQSGTNYELLDYLSEDFKKINKYPIIKKQSIIDGSYMNYSFDLDSDFTKVLKGILNDYRDNLDEYMLPWRLFITNNASVERKRVLDVGMFDEAIVGYGFEDYDLGIRLYKSGSKFIYDEDILSVHQEHPTNIKAVEIGTNTSYICNKYNNIYFIDVILVCMAYATSINLSHLNELVKDINKMLELSYFKPLLNIFLELLQIRRKQFFKEDIYNNYSFIYANNIDVIKLIKEMYILQNSFGIKYFSQAMLGLINDVYN
ncbi:glycosyltransferase family 2 protein [Clostridium butyricum]|uniref:Glycosyltransferase n=1 Tax=Clostridium butyricum TaxID=1492 RepID=A0A6L9EPF4_CLOBU|nr:glycosyltransferase family 2 protein [Clostridium butyricum]MDU1004956.1 glycosyltransferase family 2 protein [Clostridium butyricum]MDU5720590.1 glycosyltransferase family 2 protein [Clostridium butyricum]MDU5818341.1 glycosyltransferase family 2 protein [Clostridium butyricum]NAS18540.1 glycosyltransferase [Clostridium butyricum]RQN12466.1 glycosyltransferase family 2 protein [Clostridium butyricum]